MRRPYISFVIQITAFATLLCTPLHAQSPQVIKVGASLPLSGKIASSGEQQLRGISLAFEEANTEFPGLLALVAEDNMGDPAKAVVGVKKLLSIDKADILFSTYSHLVSPVTELAKQAGIPFLYSSAGTNRPLSEYRYAFKDWSEARAQGDTLADALAKAGKRRVVFLGEQNEVCEDIVQGFEQRASSHGISILATEEFLPGEHDFRALLIKLASKHPEAFVFCDFRDAGVIMMQYKALSLLHIPSLHVFAPLLPSSDTADIRNIFEENKAQSVWVDFIEGSLRPHQKAFYQKYEARFGVAPRIEAAFAYDAGTVLAMVAKACRGNASLTQCLSSELEEVSLDGVAGTLTFGKDHNSGRQSVMIRVRNGIWERSS